MDSFEKYSSRDYVGCQEPDRVGTYLLDKLFVGIVMTAVQRPVGLPLLHNYIDQGRPVPM